MVAAVYVKYSILLFSISHKSPNKMLYFWRQQSALGSCVRFYQKKNAFYSKKLEIYRTLFSWFQDFRIQHMTTKIQTLYIFGTDDLPQNIWMFVDPFNLRTPGTFKMRVSRAELTVRFIRKHQYGSYFIFSADLNHT